MCVHKGLFPLQAEARLPQLAQYANVGDVGRAAKDWPQLNFAIYHSGYRHLGGAPADGMERMGTTRPPVMVERPRRDPVEAWRDQRLWRPRLDFAWTVIAQPRLAAAMMGTLIKGLGADHVIWGTDAVWTGSPQWQIEALRRLEIPDDMQRQHGFAPSARPTGR